MGGDHIYIYIHMHTHIHIYIYIHIYAYPYLSKFTPGHEAALWQVLARKGLGSPELLHAVRVSAWHFWDLGVPTRICTLKYSHMSV